MSNFFQIIWANALVILGSVVLLWSLKRWIERQK